MDMGAPSYGSTPEINKDLNLCRESLNLVFSFLTYLRYGCLEVALGTLSIGQIFRCMMCIPYDLVLS
jgi:hypothetical protein